MKRIVWALPVLVSLLLLPTASARTIEFTTTQVTEADVTVSPDGQWLIFTMLGHLFRLPVTGGTAEQLSFGPYSDSEPVFSPDGTRVAFVSDRDGSVGNIFVLELATGQITQVTHEPWAARPAWSPDGQAIAYFLFVPKAAYEYPFQYVYEMAVVPALLRRVTLRGGEPETLVAPAREFGSVFYLRDGRLAWTVIERETNPPRATTRIEVMSPQGTLSALRVLDGVVDHVVASPAGDGVYCRRYLPIFGSIRQPEHLLFLPLPEGAERQVIPLPPTDPPSYFGRGLEFALAAGHKNVYLGANGRLLKVGLPDGLRETIAFTARVRLEIQDPIPPRKATFLPAGSSLSPRGVLDPRLSPDGRTLIFGAAGHLWQQSLDSARDGPAKRLFEGSAFESWPAFSPDGRQLALVRTEYGREEVRVFNFATRQMRTLASGLSYVELSWSPDSQRLVFLEAEDLGPRGSASVVVVNLSDGKQEKLTESTWRRARPHFSPDGQSLYFSGPPGLGTLYRLRLADKAKPEPVTRLARPVLQALVSPNGKWLAFRRNVEIWVAPLGTAPVKEEDVHQLSPEGGETFSFSPDGAAVIYSAGNRVWRRPLAGGEREEIPIRLKLERPTPPPLLLRRLRVLDFKAGGFGPETSVFIEHGRIRWIGSERGRTLPRGTVILDAGGRFAIPGLFDLHVHSGINFQDQAAFLPYGITSVRDVGGLLKSLTALADRSEATGDPVPRYFFSGPIFSGLEPLRDGVSQISLLLDNQDDARSYVRRWNEWGVHFIKIIGLPWPLQRAVAEEARRLGLPVVGHGILLEEITRSVTLGFTSLEHMPRPRVYDDVIQMLALAGTRWDMTSALEVRVELWRRDEPERWLDAKLQAFNAKWRIRSLLRSRYFGQVGDYTLRGMWGERLRVIRAAHQRGVKLQAGTDVYLVPAGASLHWELEHLVEAGIPPLEVLRIATKDAAEAVGAQDDLGTLEPGKLADIVLLDKNPLENIRNTQTIWRVMKGGWLFDPEKLRPPLPGDANK